MHIYCRTQKYIYGFRLQYYSMFSLRILFSLWDILLCFHILWLDPSRAQSSITFRQFRVWVRVYDMKWDEWDVHDLRIIVKAGALLHPKVAGPQCQIAYTELLRSMIVNLVQRMIVMRWGDSYDMIRQMLTMGNNYLVVVIQFYSYLSVHCVTAARDSWIAGNSRCFHPRPKY